MEEGQEVRGKGGSGLKGTDELECCVKDYIVLIVQR